MRRTARLTVQQLEERAVPAVFGKPWPTSNISLSFAPDGTDINGVTSNLSASLSALGGDAARAQILRAFENWVANANINIGLVGDSGDAYNASGAVQGDSRFGDIRLGGRAWAADVLALTTPFNYFDTQSGNVAVNTGVPLSLGGGAGTFDLYTIMLQESGHTLGIGNSTDLNSVMYEYYQGPRTGLSAGDIASIQALYGARRGDALEGLVGNNTLATATAYSGPVSADISTKTDADCFSFTLAPNSTSATVRLQAAGLSLLEARVEVRDSLGHIVAAGSAQDVFHNDITLSVAAPAPAPTGGLLGLSNLAPSGTYYVTVSGVQSDGFGIGSYRLTIDGATASSATVATATVAGAQQLAGSFGSLAAAATLTQQVSSVDQRIDYAAQVTPDAQSGVTYLRLHSPAQAGSAPVYMVVAAATTDPLADVHLAAFDAAGNALDARILNDRAGNAVIQVNGTQPGTDYFVRVSTSAAFGLTVDFTTHDTPVELGAIGTNSGTVQAANLTVTQSQVTSFTLAVGAGEGSVVMTIFDTNGVPIFVLTGAAGSARSASVFLQKGTYRTEISLLPAATNFAGLTYQVSGYVLTDPIGAPVMDPTLNPVGSPPPPPPAAPPPCGPTVSWTAISPVVGVVWF